MARGKIQIKKIENSTNRQVTYSKRRNGLFKKASELTVLCDAKVSIIMVSCTDKLHEYISPSITMKQFFDQYQKASGIDLWNSHYQVLKQQLLEEKNSMQAAFGNLLEENKISKDHETSPPPDESKELPNSSILNDNETNPTLDEDKSPKTARECKRKRALACWEWDNVLDLCSSEEDADLVEDELDDSSDSGSAFILMPRNARARSLSSKRVFLG